MKRFEVCECWRKAPLTNQCHFGLCSYRGWLNGSLPLCFARYTWAWRNEVHMQSRALFSTNSRRWLMEDLSVTWPVSPSFTPLSSSFHLFVSSPHCLFFLFSFGAIVDHLIFVILSLGFSFVCSSSCFFLPLLIPPCLHQVQPVVSRSSLATVPSGMSREDDAGRSHSTKKGPFHEIFNLPETERPLAGEETYYNHCKLSTEVVKGCKLNLRFFFFFPLLVCENGWRCCLINRDRKMPTDYIRNGVLYVTEK